MNVNVHNYNTRKMRTLHTFKTKHEFAPKKILQYNIPNTLIMLVHTGNQQKRAGIHTKIIYNTGPIQEIQQATAVVGKEDYHVFYYIVI